MLVFCASALSAQSLYMPRNIQRAYERQTRSHDGRPGPKYWQNHASYRINASVDLATRELSGRAEIRYSNQSPDTLTMIRLKLAHDLYRKNGLRGNDLNVAAITEGVFVPQVRVAGTPVETKALRQHSTFLDVKLDSPLPPGQSFDLGVDWAYITPPAAGAPREGAYDSTTWFVPYWYPQVAVYDDLHGWADAPYNGLQEMYNDFADYEVRITVPSNIMVWATGIWQNVEAMLKPDFLRRYDEAQHSESVVKIFTPQDYTYGGNFFKTEANGTHTFEYKAEQVPDFAFAFSSYYLWDATTTIVDAATGRKAFVSATYNPKSQDYYQVCRVAADGLNLMSRWVPGYPYPYPSMTVFNGSGGMEFPMMCNDGSTHPNSPTGLTVHETAHTYFPFMMGINEQYYAWMDEGWAAFFDVVVTDSLAGKPEGRLRNYPDFAGTENDMPPMTPSRFLSNPAYRVASYNRAQAAYFNLYQLLGYDRFHRCMVEYMNRWKGKHPQPFDFFNTWNATAGENLDWFWKPWFFDWGYPDLAVAEVGPKGIVVENTGTMPMSVVGEIEYKDGTKESFRHTASVWRSGKRTFLVPVAAGKTVQKVTLGDPHVSDTVKENNVWPQ
ncbi:MAG: M1 family metallopeptidase [Saprospiraceae bacterium]